MIFCVLNNTRYILYKSIQNAVNFNINDYDCLTHNLSTPYDVAKLYYEIYIFLILNYMNIIKIVSMKLYIIFLTLNQYLLML